MKLEKAFTFSDKKNIWRLLISDSDKLLIETRDIEKREVFFHCLDIKNGKNILSNLQLDEKYWVGIEAIHNDLIFFHKFAKPDMPEHKQIIAYDINSKKIIWQTENYSFLTFYNNDLYVFKQKYEGRDFFIIDYLTGEIIKELGSDSAKMNEIIYKSRELEDFSNYKYPERNIIYENEKYKLIIKNELSGKNSSEDVESLVFKNLFMFNYYLKSSNNLLDNIFVVYDIELKKKLFNIILNKNLNAFVPDSFFCYKDNLILLKNRNELQSYKIK